MEGKRSVLGPVSCFFQVVVVVNVMRQRKTTARIQKHTCIINI